MHLTHALALSLPALACAQAQKPLIENLQDTASSYLSKAKSYFDTSASAAAPAAKIAKDPVGASAAKIAAANVTPLSISNYESFLTPDPLGPSLQEYMVFVSGGNKTCTGHCTHVEREWNETASLLAADPTAPKLGFVNCDSQGVLCATWMAKPPTIWHIQRPVPQPDQSAPATTIWVNYLNITTSSAGDMVALHTGKKYETGILYEGFFHPFDGPLAQLGLIKPLGYVLFGFGMVPSWAFMILVSMVSRTVM